MRSGSVGTVPRTATLRRLRPAGFGVIMGLNTLNHHIYTSDPTLGPFWDFMAHFGASMGYAVPLLYQASGNYAAPKKMDLSQVRP